LMVPIDFDVRIPALGRAHNLMRGLHKRLDNSAIKNLHFLWGATGLYIYLFWSHDFPVGNSNGNTNGNANGNTIGNHRLS